MKPEHTQKGNPHQLTLLQHIFPSKSIDRFCNGNGVVDMYMFNHGKRRTAKPSDKFFCARRKWDERAEKGYGKDVEDEFQQVVDRVLREKSIVLPSENLSITKFYALWNLRYHWSKVSSEDIPIRGIKGSELEPITLDTQEMLEKNYIVSMTNELSFPARQINGLAMQMNIDSFVANMLDARWGVLFASEGEFIVPDNFLERRIVPITPKVCFVAEHESGVLSGQDVARINSLAIEFSSEYIFAKDLGVVRDKLASLGIAI